MRAWFVIHKKKERGGWKKSRRETQVGGGRRREEEGETQVGGGRRRECNQIEARHSVADGDVGAAWSSEDAKLGPNRR